MFRIASLLCGDEISYADLAALREFVSHDAGKIIPDNVWTKHPRIRAWFERLSARPATKAVSEWQYDALGKSWPGNSRLHSTAESPCSRPRKPMAATTTEYLTWAKQTTISRESNDGWNRPVEGRACSRSLLTLDVQESA